MRNSQRPKIETLASFMRAEAWRSDAARSLDHAIVFWVSRGQGRVMVDCRTHGLSANSLVYIPPHTLFSYEMVGMPQGMVLTLPREGPELPVDPMVIKAVPSQSQHELNGLIDALLRESADDATGAAQAIEAHLMLLGVLLERLDVAAPVPKTRKSDKLLSRFSHILSIQHRSGKNLSDFASDLDITPTHLTRLTQDATGKPASILVQERIIHAACNALLNTNSSVKEIARDLGFGSAAYFTRAFQNHTGMNPSTYRKTKRG